MVHVSIIVPCRNEEATIRSLLEGIYAQRYPQDQIEVIIADGRSDDGSRAVITAFGESHPDLSIMVIDNPAQTIPAALNRALAVARGQIIIRLDAHSYPHSDYVARCVAALNQGFGDNVGGVWEIQPGGEGWVAAAIAAAAAHPLAVGDAHYRHATRAARVDTVPFGAFRRDLITRIGLFDEGLLTNEDYEFNVRVRQSGGAVWLDPAIRATYIARPTLEGLARQYWRYGFWKARMLRRYPETLRWRQATPPLFVLSLSLLILLAPWRPVARMVLSAAVCFYGMALVATAAQLAGRTRSPALLVGVPAAVATMHMAWGSGFLWSLWTPMGAEHGRAV